MTQEGIRAALAAAVVALFGLGTPQVAEARAHHRVHHEHHHAVQNKKICFETVNGRRHRVPCGGPAPSLLRDPYGNGSITPHGEFVQPISAFC
jgi:hypothetical protein